MNKQIDVSTLNIRRWGIAALLLFATAAAEARVVLHPPAGRPSAHSDTPSSPLLRGVKPLKNWERSAGDAIAGHHAERRPLILVPGEAPSTVDEDGEVPHKAQPIVWNLDYPAPGKLKLGHWKFGQTRGVGLVASFPLSGKQ